MTDVADVGIETDDPAIRILRHRNQPALWLTRRTGNRIEVDKARRVMYGRSRWTAEERVLIADVFDLPLDVLWPAQAQEEVA